MGSKVISFQVPDDLYEEFEKRCRNEGVSPADKLREFVDSVCYPTQDEKTGASPELAKLRDISQGWRTELGSWQGELESLSALAKVTESMKMPADETLSQLLERLKTLDTGSGATDKAITEAQEEGQEEEATS
ncbi:hypothetical protein ACFLUU_07825 [Chloroflexota bacterium]